MSYLDPRGGYAGERSSDADVPETFVWDDPPGDKPAGGGAPADELPDPYAAYRLLGNESPDLYARHLPTADGARPTSLEDAPADRPAWEALTPRPAWDAAAAATSTAQAEWDQAQAERSAESPVEPAPATAETPPGKRGRGRRRAGRGRTSGRAGRNLPAAIAVGLGLGALVLVPLILWKPAFLAVIALAACVGIAEVARALKTTGVAPPLIPLLAGGLLTIGLTWYAGVDALVLGVVVTILAALVWRLADGPAALRRDLAASVLIAVYVPFLLGFAVLLVEPDDGAWRVVSALIAVVLSDTGGYAAGVFFGKRPMAPTISPKKSWEGFAGSLLAAAIGSALVFFFALHAPFYWGLVFGAAVAAVAVLGDLAESMLKRDIGIKDMSRLLPGHGGLMDRLDSILFAVPTAYLLLSLLAPAR
jgi:phosphatidate cytidylyltransferase